METIVVEGGSSGKRVIVDGNNEGSVEVGASTSQTFEYKGKIEIRVLGLDVGNPPVQSGQSDGE